MLNAKVIWITGLSGAGKSTLAAEVVERLRSHGLAAVMLDGDELREVFGATATNASNHGRAGRLALALQYAHLCRVLSAQGLIVVIATISMFREIHSWNRENLSGYFEVYLRVPLQELRRRDPKGIYRNFDAGEITDVAGLDMQIDEPEKAEWIFEFDPSKTASGMADDVIAYLMQREIHDEQNDIESR
jgi:adenylylsulfate kinase